ncbi:MAG: type II secretion system protein [Candidatus Saccharibacteria bacterium]|nr:type II secretion system protein [Candidatus Saccharibacteria bacterium]
MRCIKKIIKSLSAGKDKNQQGFTIVEVMIVLAIAGLILAVVFVAVPALNRNQRNSGRNNDRAFIRTQYDQSLANAGGRVPTTIQYNPNEVNHVGAAGLEKLTTALNSAYSIKPAQILYMQGTNFKSAGVVQFVGGSGCKGRDVTGTLNVAEASSTQVKCESTSPHSGETAVNTEGTWTGFNEADQLLIITGSKCSSTASPQSTGTPKQVKATDIAPSGISSSLAIFYMLEGDSVTYCVDDIN